MYYPTAKSCVLNQNWNGSESDLITGLFRPAVQYQSDVSGTSKIRTIRYLSDGIWSDEINDVIPSKLILWQQEMLINADAYDH